jgi:ABC-type phosphate/phosphonate transport system permease subunit
MSTNFVIVALGGTLIGAFFAVVIYFLDRNKVHK